MRFNHLVSTQSATCPASRYAPMLSLWWLATTRLAPYMKFLRCVAAVSNIRPSRFRLRVEAFIGGSMVLLKLTVNQVS